MVVPPVPLMVIAVGTSLPLNVVAARAINRDQSSPPSAEIVANELVLLTIIVSTPSADTVRAPCR